MVCTPAPPSLSHLHDGLSSRMMVYPENLLEEKLSFTFYVLRDRKRGGGKTLRAGEEGRLDLQ